MIETILLADLTEKEDGCNSDKEGDEFDIMDNLGEATRESSMDQDMNDHHEIKNLRAR